MKLPFNEITIKEWGGPNAYREGRLLSERGGVSTATWDPAERTMQGLIVWGSHNIRTGARVLSDNSLENRCPCRDSVERGVVCSHVIALAFSLLAQSRDPERERKEQEEARQAEHIRLLSEQAFLRRVPRGSAGALDCSLRLVLPEGWQEETRSEGLTPLEILIDFDGGMTRRIDAVPRTITLGMTDTDDSLLFVLEDIAASRVPGRMHLKGADFLSVLALLKGKTLGVAGGEPVRILEDTARSTLSVSLDHETGRLMLTISSAPSSRPPAPKPREKFSLLSAARAPAAKAAADAARPLYVVGGTRGFVFSDGAFRPLEKVLPEALHEIYAHPVPVERPAVPRFLREDLPLLRHVLDVETEVEPEIFDITPETPRFRLVIRGSSASLAMELFALYGDVSLPCGAVSPAGHFAHPDETDILRYTVRNPEAEKRALWALDAHGVGGPNGAALTTVSGERNVLNFIGASVPALHRRGWEIGYAGRIKMTAEQSLSVVPVVRIDGAAGSWFDVSVFYKVYLPRGRSITIPPSEVQRALLKGDAYCRWEGKTILLDTGAINSLQSVFADCSTGEGAHRGSFRLSAVHAAYVAGALEALDGVDIDAPDEWEARAREQNSLAPKDDTPPDARLKKILRPYQVQGVKWLRFLERNRFAGILADEMGLGKTLQTLAWISEMLPRMRQESAAEAGKRGKGGAPNRPALIICPTSLVENWAAEAKQFTPWLKVVTMKGLDRHARWGDLETADVAVTSYALLRRDVDEYAEREFSAAILDEGQNIKNPGSQNAKAAKRLHAWHRLVLTGTPIENGVFDVWSIMDFLMPSYLGSLEAFKRSTAQPVAAGGPEGEMAQWKLRRKLRPFLLRRLKKDVVKELPPKIVRMAKCRLSPDQEAVYRALLDESRREINEMVGEKGFRESRFKILRILMRLRQTCCHLELLPKMNLPKAVKEPSGKMDLFFELLDEAIAGGHRVLVFSQFTSMLGLLRRALDEREIRYCYLDGATKDRLERVRQFNTDAGIPVFLISLKAGGTGLNLTGADMVIHFDPWWNPAVEDQATDRAHRIGQKNTVYAIKLVTEGTIEERVIGLQKRKQELYQATIGGDEAMDMTQSLTWSDVQELLDL